MLFLLKNGQVFYGCSSYQLELKLLFCPHRLDREAALKCCDIKYSHVLVSVMNHYMFLQLTPDRGSSAVAGRWGQGS